MAKRMDPILPILSILGYWATTLGSFGGPGRAQKYVKQGPQWYLGPEPLNIDYCPKFLGVDLSIPQGSICEKNAYFRA